MQENPSSYLLIFLFFFKSAKCTEKEPLVTVNIDFHTLINNLKTIKLFSSKCKRQKGIEIEFFIHFYILHLGIRLTHASAHHYANDKKGKTKPNQTFEGS
jgi:hypothetical protein